MIVKRSKTLTVQKVPVLVCHICHSNPSYCVVFKDPDNPGPLIKYREFSFYQPTQVLRACDKHVPEVVAIILKQQGLLKGEEL